MEGSQRNIRSKLITTKVNCNLCTELSSQMDNLPLLRANHVKHKSNGSSFARRSTYIGKKKYARFGLALLVGWLVSWTDKHFPCLLCSSTPLHSSPVAMGQ